MPHRVTRRTPNSLQCFEQGGQDDGGDGVGQSGLRQERSRGAPGHLRGLSESGWKTYLPAIPYRRMREG
ncbi:hypothetical protein GCM10010094_67690 [Streptomyces flaveus]|uniref:Uncharacterized protein n=1 Tax=Streptomyces flaveus TaxID=66370 RepID=A0A917RAG2_9ACTN|nr:hypothetical protein GCM10010094_67690 [Streptomyces flaveus]